MTLGAGPPWVVELGRSLRQSFLMLWETLWPLVLGFTAAGALQAFVRGEGVRRRLGDHRPRAVVRAAGYGAASSSCSYAAAAMAKSLVARGADFVAALVFMVASTNLVIELGVVLLVLMGWQFAASEFVGGAVMIALLALGGGLWFRGRQVSEARSRLGAEGGADGHHGQVSESPRPPAPGPSWSRRVRSLAGWADAAGYAVADVSMVRGELLVGYAVAGFLTVAVPVHFWDVLFLHGHGTWTTLENVAVGPLVAVASFVCSIGNVPLAAALWSGGISFGGVVAFVFADLITFPLLLVYRRYYGTRLTLRILSLLWVAMALAGLVTEGLFRAAGVVPVHRGGLVASARPGWDPTTFLDLASLVLLAGLVGLHRHRHRPGVDGDHVPGAVCERHAHPPVVAATTTTTTTTTTAAAAAAGAVAAVAVAGSSPTPARADGGREAPKAEVGSR